MKTNYTDEQLQAAIDEACLEIHRNHRVKVGSTLIIAPNALSSAYAAEESVRLDLIKSALDALPEPEPPTVDWKAKAERVEHERNGWSQMHGDMKVRAEKAEAELARVREACDRMSEQEVLSRSQLRPLAEAGEVPEGCVRHYTYKQDGEWTTATKHRAMQDTHYIDTRLSEPSEKPDPYAELKAAHAAGKMIQINCCTVEHPNWIDLPSPAFFGKPHEYRIKPEPETFEAHGKTWTRHTPGDAMPCDGSSAVMALLGDGTFCTQQAEDWNWNNRDSTFDIVGWRYADKPTPEGIIQLVERLDKAEELIREIRDDEVNAQDEADKFLRDHQPSELAKMRAANAELLERLAEARDSHLAASARDVQTIQRQAILLQRLAGALEKMLYIIGEPSAKPETLWRTDDEVNEAYHTSLEALSAYESANLESVTNPIDEAVRRMEEVPVLELNKLHFDAMDYGNFNDIEAVRTRLIQAAKGDSYE